MQVSSFQATINQYEIRRTHALITATACCALSAIALSVICGLSGQAPFSGQENIFDALAITPLAVALVGLCVAGHAHHKVTTTRAAAAAAVKIQALYRGQKTRTNIAPLKAAAMPQGQYYDTVRKSVNRANLRQAAHGNTDVRFTDSTVIKSCEPGVNKVRMQKIITARSICKENNYTRLLVPRARTCRDLLFQEKVNNAIFDQKEAMGFYYENHAAFTPAVLQLTDFLIHNDLNDILGKSTALYHALSPNLLARFDNLLVCRDFTIALIDLEGFTPNASQEVHQLREKCALAIYLFPYHFDVIMQKVEQYRAPFSEIEIEALQNARNMALQNYEIIYHSHQSFAQRHALTVAEPKKAVNVAVDSDTICNATVEALSQKGCLRPTDVETFKQHFPIILQSTKNVIQSSINRELLQGPIASESALLTRRTITICYHNEASNHSNPLQKHFEDHLCPLLDLNVTPSRFTITMLDAIISTLVNAGAYAGYHQIPENHPLHRQIPNNKQWLVRYLFC